MNEVESVVDEYRACGGGDGGETSTATNMDELLEEIRDDADYFDADVSLELPRRRRNLILPVKRQALDRGESLDNAVGAGMEQIHNKEKVLRYPDEFVRQKTLDLLGDLFLLGLPLKARIKAYRVGHGHNVNLVKQLAAQMTGEVPPVPSSVSSSY